MAERGVEPAGVEVWIVAPQAIDDRRLAACGALLDGADRERLGRLKREEDQRAFLLGRALLRTALSAYAPLEPRAWAFECGAHGRPEIAPGLTGLPLRFNLTHTAGLVACAVTIGRDVGIDAESRLRRGDRLDLARRYFAPLEAAALSELPEAARLSRFFDYWTLKESYVKARGLGLTLPLRCFWFTLDPIRIHFDPQIEDDAATWQFARFEPTPEHVLAVAVRCNAQERVAIELREDLPPGF